MVQGPLNLVAPVSRPNGVHPSGASGMSGHEVHDVSARPTGDGGKSRNEFSKELDRAGERPDRSATETDGQSSLATSGSAASDKQPSSAESSGASIENSNLIQGALSGLLEGQLGLQAGPQLGLQAGLKQGLTPATATGLKGSELTNVDGDPADLLLNQSGTRGSQIGGLANGLSAGTTGGLGQIAAKLGLPSGINGSLTPQTAATPSQLQNSTSALEANIEGEFATEDGFVSQSAKESQGGRSSLASDFAQMMKGEGSSHASSASGGQSSTPTAASLLAQAQTGSSADGNIVPLPQSASTSGGSDVFRAGAAQIVTSYNAMGMAPETAEQLELNIGRFINAGREHFKVQLHPQELGRIDVRLERTEDGSMLAKVIVERPETLDLLQRDIRVLERSLQQSGVRLSGDGIDLNLKDNGEQADQQGQGEQEANGDQNDDGQNAQADQLIAGADVIDPTLLMMMEAEADGMIPTHLMNAYLQRGTVQLDMKV